MTVYFIYEKKKNLSPILYSFTTSKELIDKFKSERKMELFSILENKMKKKDFKIFERDHSGIELTSGNFVTYMDNGDRIIRKNISIVCTYNEEMEPYANEGLIIKEISKTTCPEATFMKPDIIRSLETFSYFFFQKYAFDHIDEVHSFLEGYNEDPLNTNFEIDGFGTFMKYHGYTMQDK